MIQLRDTVKPDIKRLNLDIKKLNGDIEYTITNLLGIIVDPSMKFIIEPRSDLEWYLKILETIVYIMNACNGTCCLVVPTIEEELTYRNNYLNSIAKYCVIYEDDFNQDYLNIYKHIIFLNTGIKNPNQINKKQEIGYTII